MTPEIFSAAELGFDQTGVSPNAVEVVSRLQRSGHAAYLVGGCIRDLILGITPKDFDIATDATPERVHSLFDRSRIIGRRFRLVHISYNRGRSREVLEVATFRSGAQQKKKSARSAAARTDNKGRIISDNVYGDIEDDVMRRDFTFNGLYYDPVHEEVLDYLGGVRDIRSQQLRMIGNPPERIAEDPVRMLRAIRFRAKLDAHIDQSMESHIANYSALILDVPAARLFDESLKFFHGGYAVACWKSLVATPLASLLFSQTMESIEAEGGHRFEDLIVRSLRNTDRRVQEELPVIAGFIFGVLLWHPFRARRDRRLDEGYNIADANWDAADRVFSIQNRVVSIPWRVRTPAIEIWEMQSALETRLPRRIYKLLANRRFRAAYDFLVLRTKIDEADPLLAKWWTDIQEVDEDGRKAMLDELRSQRQGKPGSGKRRRRSRSRSRSGNRRGPQGRSESS